MVELAQNAPEPPDSYDIKQPHPRKDCGVARVSENILFGQQFESVLLQISRNRQRRRRWFQIFVSFSGGNLAFLWIFISIVW